MATNDFKPFAVGAGANVTTQADYEALAALITGFQSGKASSAQINKAIRQSSVMASVLAQFISDSASVDVLDNGNTASLLANLKTALNLIAQGRLTAVRVFTASGTYTPTAGTKKIKVTVIGGGGGGGGSAATDSTTRSCGGGGGAGNTTISILDVTALSLPIAITIGTQGSQGAAGGSSGGSGGQGGTTQFGTLLSSLGGAGGGGGSQTTDSLATVTPNGGTSNASTSGNILNQRGSPGLQGIVGSGNIVSGAGGASSLGGGGNPISASISTNGDNGIYGGGGSGAVSVKSSSVGKPGGSGGAGVVLIEEYA